MEIVDQWTWYGVAGEGERPRYFTKPSDALDHLHKFGPTDKLTFTRLNTRLVRDVEEITLDQLSEYARKER